MRTVEVLVFARVRDLVGADSVTVYVPDGATIRDLREAMTMQFPALAALAPHCMFAINNDYADAAAVVPQGAEVACIPPVSGGAPTPALR